MASPSPDRVSRLRFFSDEFCPPQRLLLACGSHFWGCCPPCHIWFQVAACGCVRSGFAFIALGIGWILRLRCCGLWTVFRTFGGGFSGIASLAVCVSCKCPQFLPFGPTLQTSAWGLTWVTGLFPACGTSRRLFFLSMPGSCWLCIMVSSTSSPFCQGPRWPSAMSPRSPIYSRGGGGRLASCSRHRCPGVPPLGGISSDSTGSTVPSGDPQCSRGLSLPSSPAPQFRMVSQLGCISIFAASVAGDVRPVFHFRPSPLLHLFSPYRDPLSAGTDALLQSWGGLLACAFPPWSVLPRVLAKLRVSH